MDRSNSEFGYETDFWTTRRLIQVIGDRFGVRLSKQTVMRRLHEAGLSYQKPERQYFELSEEERRVQVPKIRRTVQKFKAILYFQDEANVSLTALLGKTWGVRGCPPKQRVTGKRGGVSALSAITSRGQLIFRLYDKRIASDEIIDFPVRCFAITRDDIWWLLWTKLRRTDRRKPWRTLPANGDCMCSISPDTLRIGNPDEKVWNHLKHQELKGHQAETKEELKAITEDKLTAMSKNPRLLEGIFFRCCMADVLDM